MVCPLRGQSLESRLAAQSSVRHSCGERQDEVGGASLPAMASSSCGWSGRQPRQLAPGPVLGWRGRQPRHRLHPRPASGPAVGLGQTGFIVKCVGVTKQRIVVAASRLEEGGVVSHRSNPRPCYSRQSRLPHSRQTARLRVPLSNGQASSRGARGIAHNRELSNNGLHQTGRGGAVAPRPVVEGRPAGEPRC